jgi:hypothetical protein
MNVTLSFHFSFILFLRFTVSATAFTFWRGKEDCPEQAVSTDKKRVLQLFLGVTEFRMTFHNLYITKRERKKKAKQGQRKRPLRQIAEYTPLAQTPGWCDAIHRCQSPNPLTDKKINKNFSKKIRQDFNKFESKKEERGALSSFVKEPGQTMA